MKTASRDLQVSLICICERSRMILGWGEAVRVERGYRQSAHPIIQLA